MVKTLKIHFEGGRNKTLSNFDFHKLKQKADESFDSFAIRIKREAASCDFKCTSATCTAMDIMIHDQIIIGTTIDEIRKNALKNQWSLVDVIKNGKALKSAIWDAKQIKPEIGEYSLSRIKRPGKYSRKGKKEPTLTAKYNEVKQELCKTCSPKTCQGGKRCPSYTRKCFDCGKNGHFRGANLCKFKSKDKYSRRVNQCETENKL